MKKRLELTEELSLSPRAPHWQVLPRRIYHHGRDRVIENKGAMSSLSPRAPHWQVGCTPLLRILLLLCILLAERQLYLLYLCLLGP